MQQIKPVTISPKHYAALKEADAAVKAINQMTQMFQQNAQARLQAAHGAARAAYEAIARETGIDLVNVSWEPHASEPLLVPVAMKLVPPANISGPGNA